MNQTRDLSKDQLELLKRWLFEEKIRIEHEKNNLEQEKYEFDQVVNEFKQEKEAHFSMHDLMKKQMIREKKLFDQQFKILERELQLLAHEKEQLKKEKELFSEYSNSQSVLKNTFLFKGINNEEGLKKRYKELIKIFHPDNCGDTELMQAINKEYEQYKFER